MHFHIEEFWTFVAGGVGFTVLSYAVRTFPKPVNKYGLWILGVLQFLLLNIEQGKNNFQAIADQKVVQDVKDTMELRIAKELQPIVEPAKKDV